jgi:hypothetical protein
MTKNSRTLSPSGSTGKQHTKIFQKSIKKLIDNDSSTQLIQDIGSKLSDRLAHVEVEIGAYRRKLDTQTENFHQMKLNTLSLYLFHRERMLLYKCFHTLRIDAQKSKREHGETLRNESSLQLEHVQKQNTILKQNVKILVNRELEWRNTLLVSRSLHALRDHALTQKLNDSKVKVTKLRSDIKSEKEKAKHVPDKSSDNRSQRKKPIIPTLDVSQQTLKKKIEESKQNTTIDTDRSSIIELTDKMQDDCDKLESLLNNQTATTNTSCEQLDTIIDEKNDNALKEALATLRKHITECKSESVNSSTMTTPRIMSARISKVKRSPQTPRPQSARSKFNNSTTSVDHLFTSSMKSVQIKLKQDEIQLTMPQDKIPRDTQSKLVLRTPLLSQESVGKDEHFKKLGHLNRKMDKIKEECDKWRSLALDYEKHFGVLRVSTPTKYTPNNSATSPTVSIPVSLRTRTPDSPIDIKVERIILSQMIDNHVTDDTSDEKIFDNDLNIDALSDIPVDNLADLYLSFSEEEEYQNEVEL